MEVDLAMVVKRISTDALVSSGVPLYVNLASRFLEPWNQEHEAENKGFWSKDLIAVDSSLASVRC